MAPTLKVLPALSQEEPASEQILAVWRALLGSKFAENVKGPERVVWLSLEGLGRAAQRR